MASLRQMRRRIASVKSVRQITKAMKMVAAARMKKAQEAILAARPYAQRMKDVLGDIVARADVSGSPLLSPSGGEKIGAVVIAGDKGLAGSFNANIFRRASAFLREAGDRPVEIVAVGRKSRDFFRRREAIFGPVRRSFTDVFARPRFSDASAVIDCVEEAYVGGEWGEAWLIYNEFKSALVQRVVVERLFPVEPTAFHGPRRPVDFIYEPSPRAVFDTLVPRYFAVRMWTAFLESYSAEMAARMTAMDQATKNAGELIDRLTLESNKIRQAQITKELAEIVGGAEALE